MHFLINKDKEFINILNKIGIFSLFLLISAMSVYFYSPVSRSDADEIENVSKVRAQIAETVSISLDKNNLGFDINPTATGTFDSGSVTATVTTNSIAGYELYFSSIDSATNMTSAGSDGIIASDFNDTVTSSTMAANKWGYSLDNTNFLKIPALASAVTIRNIDHYPASAERENTIYIGTKVSSDLPAGLYSKNVQFSALAHEAPIPFGGIDTMQEMQSAYCSMTPVGATTTMIDTRNGSTYPVAKLLDGKCWMTRNLAIADKEISSEDSDLPSGETWTIPESNLSGHFKASGIHVYIDTSTADYGGYYSYDAATAGWGASEAATGNTSSPQSICPKGWRLPTKSEYDALAGLYNGRASALMAQPFNVQLAGHIDRDYQEDFHGVGTSGYLYTADVVDLNSIGSNHAWILFAQYGTSYDYSYTNQSESYQGRSVRCIAK